MLDCNLLLDSAKRFGFILVEGVSTFATREYFSGDHNYCYSPAASYVVVNE